LVEHPNAVTRHEANLGWAHVYVTRGYWHARNGRRIEAARDYWSSFALKPLVHSMQ
jgi:hypothetical protein